MWVTSDELELPLAVADTSIELAAIVGVKPCTIQSMCRKAFKGQNLRYHCVSVDDNDDE